MFSLIYILHYKVKNCKTLNMKSDFYGVRTFNSIWLLLKGVDCAALKRCSLKDNY